MRKTGGGCVRNGPVTAVRRVPGTFPRPAWAVPRPGASGPVTRLHTPFPPLS